MDNIDVAEMSLANISVTDIVGVMPRDNAHAQAPLTPAVLHILLALSTGPRHGYGIMKQVKEDSDDKITRGPARFMALSPDDRRGTHSRERQKN